jgi:protein TonB
MPISAANHLPVSRHSPVLLAAVLLGHAGVLLAVVTMQQVDEAVAPPRALTVSLIEMPEEARRPEPRPQPPRPVVKPQPKPQVLAVAQPKAAPAEQTPVLAELPKPVAEPEPQPAAPAAAAEASRPAPPPPLVEPRFDANYLDNPRPSYPSLSRRLGEQGTVQLRVFVNADGRVGKLELRRSSGHPRLDRSAMNAVQAWRFVPARQGSQAVAAWVVVPIHFTLGS